MLQLFKVTGRGDVLRLEVRCGTQDPEVSSLLLVGSYPTPFLGYLLFYTQILTKKLDILKGLGCLVLGVGLVC